MNPKVRELIDAILEEIGPLSDQTNFICHRGITTAERCSRCSRERRIHDAIKALEEE